MDSVRAVRYSRGDPWPDYQTDTPGATDGYSSAHDLISFALFHMKHGGQAGRALLSERAIHLLQRPTSPNSDGESYGVTLGYPSLLLGDAHEAPTVAPSRPPSIEIPRLRESLPRVRVMRGHDQLGSVSR